MEQLHDLILTNGNNNGKCFVVGFIQALLSILLALGTSRWLVAPLGRGKEMNHPLKRSPNKYRIFVFFCSGVGGGGVWWLLLFRFSYVEDMAC